MIAKEKKLYALLVLSMGTPFLLGTVALERPSISQDLTRSWIDLSGDGKKVDFSELPAGLPTTYQIRNPGNSSVRQSSLSDRINARRAGLKTVSVPVERRGDPVGREVATRSVQPSQLPAGVKPMSKKEFSKELDEFDIVFGDGPSVSAGKVERGYKGQNSIVANLIGRTSREDIAAGLSEEKAGKQFKREQKRLAREEKARKSSVWYKLRKRLTPSKRKVKPVIISMDNLDSFGQGASRERHPLDGQKGYWRGGEFVPAPNKSVFARLRSRLHI